MQKAPLETVDTLAARFGLPTRTIVREVMCSRLPYVSVAGCWRFRARDIEVWLERKGTLPRMLLVAGGQQEGRPRPRAHRSRAASSVSTVDSGGQERTDPATRR